MGLISANIREKNVSHSARKERKKGKIPGVLYGKSIKNTLFEIGEIELNREISKEGEHGVIDLNIGGITHKTLIKEIQKEPINHKIIHIDLEELSRNHIINTEVPISFIGENTVVHNGGILQKERNTVKIQCMPENIPKTINADISNMQIGDVLKIGNLEIAEEIIVTEDCNNVILSITSNNTNLEVNDIDELEDMLDNKENIVYSEEKEE